MDVPLVRGNLNVMMRSIFIFKYLNIDIQGLNRACGYRPVGSMDHSKNFSTYLRDIILDFWHILYLPDSLLTRTLKDKFIQVAFYKYRL